jgi:anti-anti-sigma factor
VQWGGATAPGEGLSRGCTGQKSFGFGNLKTWPSPLLYVQGMMSGDRDTRAFEGARVAGMKRLRFALEGDLDTAEVDALRLAMLQAIGEGPAHVTLDASKIGFSGAAYLGLLAELRQRLEEAGGGLAIKGANPATARIMMLCDMGHLLVEDEQDPPATIVLPDHVISLTGHLQNLK